MWGGVVKSNANHSTDHFVNLVFCLLGMVHTAIGRLIQPVYATLPVASWPCKHRDQSKLKCVFVNLSSLWEDRKGDISCSLLTCTPEIESKTVEERGWGSLSAWVGLLEQSLKWSVCRKAALASALCSFLLCLNTFMKHPVPGSREIPLELEEFNRTKISCASLEWNQKYSYWLDLCSPTFYQPGVPLCC